VPARNSSATRGHASLRARFPILHIGLTTGIHKLFGVNPDISQRFEPLGSVLRAFRWR